MKGRKEESKSKKSHIELIMNTYKTKNTLPKLSKPIKYPISKLYHTFKTIVYTLQLKDVYNYFTLTHTHLQTNTKFFKHTSENFFIKISNVRKHTFVFE